MTKTWLITGAAGGLGQQLVKAAIDAGHGVLATDLRADALPDPQDGGDGRLRTMALDVRDADGARAAVRYAVDAFGGLDVVVNGAGHRGVGSIEDMPADEFRRAIETNLFGAVNMVRAALPVLRPRRSGHFVQISTVGGRRAQPGLGAYQTSKWALGAFSEILGREIGPLGLRSTVVEPGGISTPWATAPISTDGLRQEYEPTVGAFARAYDQNQDVRRGDPARMARAILRITEEPDPPARLLLGSDTVWLAQLIAEARAAEDEKWHRLSLSTDFDGLTDFSETDVARLVRPPRPPSNRAPGRPPRGEGRPAPDEDRTPSPSQEEADS
jgi:NAD(P)-dependent dehydrogenase (short-subunit alcohol dehydrogenase family)